MTNEITVPQPIDKKKLSRARYFQSLLAAAQAEGLIDSAEIRRQTISLAAKLAGRLTFGASASVKAETAQGLIESVMYTVGYRIKTMQTGDALNVLKSEPFEQIWKTGRDMIREDVRKAQALLSSLQSNAVRTENIAYNGTLSEGLPSFFAAYDIDFAAHDTPCLIDYPLCVELPELYGIEYIQAYLERLEIENEFCHAFSPPDGLLKNLGEGWRDLNENLFALLLINAAGCVLGGKQATELNITGGDRERLQASLEAMPLQRLKLALRLAAERACAQTGQREDVRAYAVRAMENICARIKNALETKSLGAVFLEIKDKKTHSARFESGKRMDDEAFRALTGEIRGCRHISDKLALIKRNIRSMDDMEDMLGAYCLMGDEFDAFFSSLDEYSLALLYKRLPEEGAFHITEGDSEWHAALSSFLESNQKTDAVREISEGIVTE